MHKILIIQTAFIGDVVLATAVLEKLHQHYPHAAIDILVRKGNEALFQEHPYLHQVLIWQKKEAKYKNLFRLLQTIRATKYDVVVNLQRYAATGLLTAFSNATIKIGFDKNPLSFLFTQKITHVFSNPNGKILHETERNQLLIESLTDATAAKPALYPTKADYAMVKPMQTKPYICIAPASVWFTKQFPVNKWIELLKQLPTEYNIYLLGAPTDTALCNTIAEAKTHPNITVLAGKLSFLQSAALQQQAMINYVNDSAPMHFASSVNAPVTAIYCSTLPSFGYGPLSTQSFIVESSTPLACRPCGVHGKTTCPQGHFNCANNITNTQLLYVLPQLHPNPNL